MLCRLLTFVCEKLALLLDGSVSVDSDLVEVTLAVMPPWPGPMPRVVMVNVCDDPPGSRSIVQFVDVQLP